MNIYLGLSHYSVGVPIGQVYTKGCFFLLLKADFMLELEVNALLYLTEILEI